MIKKSLLDYLDGVVAPRCAELMAGAPGSQVFAALGSLTTSSVGAYGFIRCSIRLKLLILAVQKFSFLHRN